MTCAKKIPFWKAFDKESISLWSTEGYRTPHGLVCRQTLLLVVCLFNSAPEGDTNCNPRPNFFKMTWAQTLSSRLKASGLHSTGRNRTLCGIYENWVGIQLHTFLDTSVKFACTVVAHYIRIRWGLDFQVQPSKCCSNIFHSSVDNNGTTLSPLTFLQSLQSACYLVKSRVPWLYGEDTR